MKSFEEYVTEIKMKPFKIEDRKLGGWKVTYDVYSASFKPEEEDEAKAKFAEVSKKFKNAKIYAVDQKGVTINQNTLNKLKK